MILPILVCDGFVIILIEKIHLPNGNNDQIQIGETTGIVEQPCYFWSLGLESCFKVTLNFYKTISSLSSC